MLIEFQNEIILLSVFHRVSYQHSNCWLFEIFKLKMLDLKHMTNFQWYIDHFRCCLNRNCKNHRQIGGLNDLLTSSTNSHNCLVLDIWNVPGLLGDCCQPPSVRTLLVRTLSQPQLRTCPTLLWHYFRPQLSCLRSALTPSHAGVHSAVLSYPSSHSLLTAHIQLEDRRCCAVYDFKKFCYRIHLVEGLFKAVNNLVLKRSLQMQIFNQIED